MEATAHAESEPAPEAVPEWFIWCDREVRHQPLAALTTAAAVGFILGGGLRSRIGRGLVLVAGRSVVRSAIYGFVSGLMEDHGTGHGD